MINKVRSEHLAISFIHNSEIGKAMKLARHYMYVLLTLMLVVLFLGVPMGTARAASSYDQAYRNIGSLVVSANWPGFAVCPSVDVTTNWSSWITDSSKRYYTDSTNVTKYEALEASFTSAVSSGGVWSVSRVTTFSGSNYIQEVHVVWSEDPSALLTWSTVGGFQSIGITKTSAVHEMYISPRANIGGGSNACDLLWGVPHTNVQSTIQISNEFGNSLTGATLPQDNLFVSISNPSYPVGYEGRSIPTPPSAAYVALGDSYSSGEGTYNYNVNSGLCHRSTDSYAYYLANQLDLGIPSLKACSGAVTHDILNSSSPAGPAQVSYLTSDTLKVTLTIGGNDLGFADVLAECAKQGSNPGWNCSSDSTLVSTMDDRLSALAGTASTTIYIHGKEIHSILDVIEEIGANSPNASIYIAGYPRLFGSSTSYFGMNSNAPGGYECAAFPVSFSYTDAQWMNAWADDLNGVIESAVNEAYLNGVDAYYVPPTLFNGHGQCDSSGPWINWIEYDGGNSALPESFHPTTSGISLGYSPVFEAIMN